jgi:hypothetical protein
MTTKPFTAYTGTDWQEYYAHVAEGLRVAADKADLSRLYPEEVTARWRATADEFASWAATRTAADHRIMPAGRFAVTSTPVDGGTARAWLYCLPCGVRVGLMFRTADLAVILTAAQDHDCPARPLAEARS